MRRRKLCAAEEFDKMFRNVVNAGVIHGGAAMPLNIDDTVKY